MSEIPEGATHEGQGAVKFWVKDLVPGVGYKFSNQRTDGSPTPWMDSTCGTPLYPIRPIWNGPDDGLPPVGTICELRSRNGGWGEAEIKYHGRAVCVWLWVRRDGNTEQIEHAERPDRLEFRPIRTAEQLAAEERERGINELLAWVEMSTILPARQLFRPFWAALYDAGLRLPVKP